MTTALLDAATGLIALFLLLATLLPRVRSGRWFIRVWDFPRLQYLAVALLGLVLGLLSVDRMFPAPHRAGMLVVITGCALVHLVRVLRYTPLWPRHVPGSSRHDLKVLISNIDFENDRKDELIQHLLRADADVLLLVEVDDRWWSALFHVRALYPFHHAEIRPEGCGMALLSRLPIRRAQTRLLVSKARPSIWAELTIGNGRHLRLIGVHPTPPGLARADGNGRHDSRVRDTELVLVGRAVGEGVAMPTIVAGDFNDVAWSRTTRTFERLSGLRDPRVGRTTLNTFPARHPLLRYPLDHVFLSPGLAVARIARLPAPGSDHFAVLAALDLADAHAWPEPDRTGALVEEADALVEEGREQAASNGDAAPHH